MADFRIGCQTITWGEKQRERFPEVFAQIASGGFAGVEIGFRHLRETSPPQLKEMLQANGLVLAASHVGGNLFDADQATRERGLLDDALEYLQAMGTELLLYSGLRYHDDAQFGRDLTMLNRAAEECRERGIKLLYHNHNWEFADNGRVIDALVNDADPHLGFCPDIGWVMKGGAEIEALLDRVKARIGALHFKDFATTGPAVDTVILGEGVAPLREAADWARRNLSGLWMIAEQDNADAPLPEVAAKNAAYLKQLLD